MQNAAVLVVLKLVLSIDAAEELDRLLGPVAAGNRAIELGARPLGRPIWNEMKENAGLASGPGGGALHVAGKVATRKKMSSASKPLIMVSPFRCRATVS